MDILSLNRTLFFKTFAMSGQNPAFDSLMVLAANYLIFLAIILIFAFALKQNIRNKKALLFTIFSMGVGFIILKLTSLIIFEPRPFLTYAIKPLLANPPTDGSFPSHHTLILSIITFSQASYKTRYTWLIFLALVLTGFARVFIGVHYPLDILGGLLIGALTVLISWQMKNWLIKNYFK